MTQRSQATRSVQEVGKLPGFKHSLDLGNECRDCLSPFTIFLGHFKEVQELLANQVAQRFFRAESSSTPRAASHQSAMTSLGVLGFQFDSCSHTVTFTAIPLERFKRF